MTSKSLCFRCFDSVYRPFFSCRLAKANAFSAFLVRCAAAMSPLFLGSLNGGDCFIYLCNYNKIFIFYTARVIEGLVHPYVPTSIRPVRVVKRLSVYCDGKKNALFFWNMIKPWPTFAADRFVAVCTPILCCALSSEDLYCSSRGASQGA